MCSGLIHPPIVKTTRWNDEAATRQFAIHMAARLVTSLADQPSSSSVYLALQGDLGAGKTTLVRHLLRSLGVSGRIKSPTYAVLESYELPMFTPSCTFWHFDFYRFDSPHEWADAGFRDIFAGQGIKLAEWPEKVAGCVPQADLVIQITATPDEIRHIVLTAHSPLGAYLLDEQADCLTVPEMPMPAHVVTDVSA